MNNKFFAIVFGVLLFMSGVVLGLQLVLLGAPIDFNYIPSPLRVMVVLGAAVICLHQLYMFTRE